MLKGAKNYTKRWKKWVKIGEKCILTCHFNFYHLERLRALFTLNSYEDKNRVYRAQNLVRLEEVID
jgi:hypothetical protein